jgi:hypothetical protein
MAHNTKAVSVKGRKRLQHRARWVSDQMICSCRSQTFTILRERVARKNHTRHSRRRR